MLTLWRLAGDTRSPEFKAKVDEVHAAYKAALLKLWEQHQHLAHDPDTNLSIVK